MSSKNNRQQVAVKTIGLCGAYLAESTSNEMGYFVLTYDLIDGISGTLYETDMEPHSAARVLRELADEIEESADGVSPNALRRH